MQMQRRDDQERKSDFEEVDAKANSKMIAEVEVKMKNAKLAEIVDFAEVDVVSECSHTISDTQIERDESFDDEEDEKLIKSVDVEVVILTEWWVLLLK